MGRMLLPEGLSGRCFPFSFFQLTRDLPGPISAGSGGGGEVFWNGGCLWGIGVSPWGPQSPPASPPGEDGSWEQEAGRAAGTGVKAFSLFLLSKEFCMCIYKKKNQPPTLNYKMLRWKWGGSPPSCLPQEAARAGEEAGVGRAVAG